MNHQAPPHCTALLVAAGSGTRMGFDKLLSPLSGRSVLQCSVDRLLACDSIHSMVIVCPLDRWHSLEIPTSAKPVIRTDGGTLRQDSVRSGIQACPAETTHVAIHDAARPLVSPEDLTRVIRAAFETGAATLAHRVVDTLKRATPDQTVRDSVCRNHLWAMETPQVFARKPLIESFQVPGTDEYTDEVSRIQAAGHSVLLVESLHPNLKITTPADLLVAGAILNAQPGT